MQSSSHAKKPRSRTIDVNSYLQAFHSRTNEKASTIYRATAPEAPRKSHKDQSPSHDQPVNNHSNAAQYPFQVQSTIITPTCRASRVYVEWLKQHISHKSRLLCTKKRRKKQITERGKKKQIRQSFTKVGK